MHEHDHSSGISFSNFKHRLLHDGHMSTTLKIVTAASAAVGTAAAYCKEPGIAAIATFVVAIVGCEQSYREQDAHALHEREEHTES